MVLRARIERPVALSLLISAVLGCAGVRRQVELKPPKDRPEVAVALRFSEGKGEPQTPSDAPTTRLHLVLIEKQGRKMVFEVDEAPGVCSHVPVRGMSLLRVQCSWLGRVVLYMVQRRGDELTVRKGDSEAPEPTAVLSTVRLPDDAKVEPIRPSTMPREL